MSDRRAAARKAIVAQDDAFGATTRALALRALARVRRPEYRSRIDSSGGGLTTIAPTRRRRAIRKNVPRARRNVERRRRASCVAVGVLRSRPPTAGEAAARPAALDHLPRLADQTLGEHGSRATERTSARTGRFVASAMSGEPIEHVARPRHDPRVAAHARRASPRPRRVCATRS